VVPEETRKKPVAQVKTRYRKDTNAQQAPTLRLGTGVTVSSSSETALQLFATGDTIYTIDREVSASCLDFYHKHVQTARRNLTKQHEERRLI
jgi:hypothetical protein